MVQDDAISQQASAATSNINAYTNRSHRSSTSAINTPSNMSGTSMVTRHYISIGSCTVLLWCLGGICFATQAALAPVVVATLQAVSWSTRDRQGSDWRACAAVYGRCGFTGHTFIAV